jgi:hypothetical protein
MCAELTYPIPNSAHNRHTCGAAGVVPLVILMDVSRFLVVALGAAWLGLAPAVLATGLTCFFCWSLVLGAFSRFLVAALGAAWLGLAPAVLAAGLLLVAVLACGWQQKHETQGALSFEAFHKQARFL